MKNSVQKKFDKLLRIDVVYSKQIDELHITGDFFMHPEPCIENIEKICKQAQLPIEKSVLLEQIEEYIQEEDIQLIGITAENIVDTLMEALHV